MRYFFEKSGRPPIWDIIPTIFNETTREAGGYDLCAVAENDGFWYKINSLCLAGFLQEREYSGSFLTESIFTVQ